MKTLWLFISAMILLCVNVLGQKTAADILMRTYNAISSHKSVEYKVACRFKPLSESDTLNFQAKVFLVRTPADSFFGAYLWMSLADSEYHFYNHSKIYRVTKSSKTATSYDVKKGEAWAIEGNTLTSEALWTLFLKPGKMKEKLAPSNKIEQLKDTMIDNQLCYHITVKLPDDGDFKDIQTTYFINAKDYVPLLTSGIVKFQDNYQYREFRLHSYTFDQVNQSKFSVTQIPASYKIAMYVAPKKERNLAIGTVAPAVSGVNFKNDSKPETIDFKGRITVLDFWYMTCYPCIKAIPQIEKLAEKYKDKPVQIFGINSKDNNEAALKRLPEFLKHNTINYPFLIVDEAITTAYKPNGFPTFYIIGKDGKVAFSTTGYSETLYDLLSGEVDKLLK